MEVVILVYSCFQQKLGQRNWNRQPIYGHVIVLVSDGGKQGSS